MTPPTEDALHMRARWAHEDYARGVGTLAMLRAEAADVAEGLAHLAQIERTQRGW